MRLKHHEYFTYMTMNSGRTTIYTGVTNNLPLRMEQHYNNRGNPTTFAGKYHCFNLVYYKSFKYINDAIAFETRIKGWSRKKKEALINEFNPTCRFLNTDIMDWPPKKDLDEGTEFRL